MDDRAEPFLKWAGGKRVLFQQLVEGFPPMSPRRRYYEPFLGGGAVFFGLRPTHATLSDVNGELIETFQAVRDDVEGVIDKLRRLAYEERTYYAVRASRPRSSTGRAARMIYLNKTCFNGLYRVNLEGGFNVPIGRHGHVVVCDRPQLKKASSALSSAALVTGDFADVLDEARAGDFVYLDPPYIVSHTTNGFVEYNARVFSWSDQERLARSAALLAERGVEVRISNADHRSITRLYGRLGFKWRRLKRWSTVAGSSSKRFLTTELLLYPEP